MPAQDLFNLVIREGLGYCLSEGRRGGRRAIVLAVAGLTTVCAGLTTVCTGLYFSGSARCREWWISMTGGWAGQSEEEQSHEVTETSLQPSVSTVGDVYIEVQPPPLSLPSPPPIVIQSEPAVLDSLVGRVQETDLLLASAQTFSLNFGN